MADKEQDYINSLNNISKAFELLVESIKNKVENERKSVAESTGASKEEAENFANFALQLSKISEDVTTTKENTDLILFHMRNDKKKGKDKKGIFSSAKENVAGVFDGIKTIALMAGAIIAMGAAFQIIGEVDFKSVIAMSIALPLLAMAFAKVNDANISIKDSLVLGVVITVMSAALVASGAILTQMPSISLMQFISAIGVGLAMGVSMIPLSYAAKQMGKNGIMGLAFLAIMMPVIASGIVKSGEILASMPSITLMQFISTVGVGLAMGASMIPLAYAANQIGKNGILGIVVLTALMPYIASGIVKSAEILKSIPIISFKQMLSTIEVGIAMGATMIPLAFAAKLIGNDTSKLFMIAIMMPVIAGAILASAAILQFVPELDTLNILESSFAITAATTIMSLGIFAMSKMGLDIKSIALGVAGMVILSAGMMVMSHILGLGDYSNYPSLEWSAGVGLAMLGSLPAILELGFLGATGIGWLVIASGIGAMLLVSAGLVGMSHILATGNYSKYPSFKWSAGVGLAMMGMLPSVIVLGSLAITGIGAWMIDLGIEQMYKLSHALVNVAAILGTGSYSGGPTKEWASGVGLSMVYFANALSAFKPGVMDLITGTSFDDNIKSLLKLAMVMPMLPQILGSSSIYEGTGPTKEWAEGVGLSLKHFASALAEFKPGVWDLLMGNTFEDNIESVKKLAKLMPQLPALLGPTSIYEGTGPTKAWAEGVGATLVSIGTMVATLADEVDPEDIYKWIQPIKHLSALIPHIAMQMRGMTFDTFPSKQWAEGVGAFLTTFSEYSADSDVTETVAGIKLLSSSYFTLAKAIMNLGYALSTLKEVPDMSNLYGGLITLSLVDSSNLKKVMDQLKVKDDSYAKMSKNLTSANTSFTTFIPERIANSGNSKKTVQNSSSNKQENKKQSKPATVNPVYKTNELLNKTYYVMKNIEKTMYEVASNTKTSKSSGIGK